MKGKRLEYEVAKALCKIGVDAKRVPLSGALSWLKGDVAEFSLRERHVHECKNCETLSLPEWWRQAMAQAVSKDETPVLHFSSNYKGIFTVLPAGEFDDMVFAYELRRKELELTLIDFPKRKNFWKFIGGGAPLTNIYLYQVDETDLVVINFDLYIKLRREMILRQADEPGPSTESQGVYNELPAIA